MLMVLLGFVRCVAGLGFANSGLLYTFGFVFGGIWGGLCLHLVMSFPSGRLEARSDRAIVLAGYLTFTVASIPAMLFGSPLDLRCDDCPTSPLLIREDEDLATAGLALEAALSGVLLVIVQVRLILRWRARLEELRASPADPACAGWPTASPRSTARSRSTAGPRDATARGDPVRARGPDLAAVRSPRTRRSRATRPAPRG